MGWGWEGRLEKEIQGGIINTTDFLKRKPHEKLLLLKVPKI